MAQPKALLAIGAAAVVAAIVVLVIALKKGDSAADNPVATEGDRIATSGLPRPPVGSGARPGSAPVVRPSDVGDVERPDRPPVREYEIDGVKIRDHRKNPTEMKLPPNIHPPEQRRISSTIVNDIHQQMRKLAPECTKSVPATERGADPKVQMQVVVTIKDKQAKVVKSTAVLADVTGGSQDSVTACLQDKAMTIVAATGDEPDIENYPINLTMPL